MSVQETITLLKNLSETMKAELVGGGEAEFYEWISIITAITELCKTLAGAKSVEEWTATITAIEAIRDRVSKMPTEHWIQTQVNKILDQCVEMIEKWGGRTPEGKDPKTKKINKLLQDMKNIIHDYETKSRQ